MTRSEQKKSERRAFELFNRLVSDPPEGSVREPKDENPEPDFVFEPSEGKMTGIEVRKLIKGEANESGSVLKQRDGIRRRILEKSYERYLEISENPVELCIDWVPSAQLPPKERGQLQEIAECLAAFVASRVPSVGESATFDRAETVGHPFSKYVGAITVWHLPDDSFQKPWHGPGNVSVRAFWQGIEPSKVQDAISAKSEAMLDGYLERCDEVWLLLHVPNRLSQEYAVGNLESNLADCQFESGGFARIYVVAESGPQLLRLS